jgi:hypothetical protein
MKSKNNVLTASFIEGGKPMLLQHNKARPHINAAASAVIVMDLILHLTMAWIWHCDF